MGGLPIAESRGLLRVGREPRAKRRPLVGKDTAFAAFDDGQASGRSWMRGSFFVHDTCFLELTLVIEPVGSLLFVGFVHDEGQWFQSSSLFGPAVQMTGVAHRIEE
jgi:hypothetical protein